MESKISQFSVLMSVYIKCKVDEVRQALDSLYSQSVRSNDIVIILDGEVTEELRLYLNEEETKGNISLHPLEKNVGSGLAYRYGLEVCKNELVAIMDSDDIAICDRFEKQLAYFSENDIDVLGGQISEFCDSEENIVGYRIVPLAHDDICKFLKKRSPINHMTSMFKKSSVVKAGSYQDFILCEDYFLWIRMYMDGAKFANLKDILVNARVGKDMYKRRRGKVNYNSEKNIYKYMRQQKIISRMGYFRAVFPRFVVQRILPTWILKWVYNKFARNKSYNVK